MDAVVDTVHEQPQTSNSQREAVGLVLTPMLLATVGAGVGVVPDVMDEAREPQSKQSVPGSQKLNWLPIPPSSQALSLA